MATCETSVHRELGQCRCFLVICRCDLLAAVSVPGELIVYVSLFKHIDIATALFSRIFIYIQ